MTPQLRYTNLSHQGKRYNLLITQGIPVASIAILSTLTPRQSTMPHNPKSINRQSNDNLILSNHPYGDQANINCSFVMPSLYLLVHQNPSVASGMKSAHFDIAYESQMNISYHSIPTISLSSNLPSINIYESLSIFSLWLSSAYMASLVFASSSC
jgi:hypothetical protein